MLADSHRRSCPQQLPARGEDQEGGLERPGAAAEAGAGEANRYPLQTTTMGLPH